jgi:hypothetical protein
LLYSIRSGTHACFLHLPQKQNRHGGGKGKPLGRIKKSKAFTGKIFCGMDVATYKKRILGQLGQPCPWQNANTCPAWQRLHPLRKK